MPGGAIGSPPINPAGHGAIGRPGAARRAAGRSAEVRPGSARAAGSYADPDPEPEWAASQDSVAMRATTPSR